MKLFEIVAQQPSMMVNLLLRALQQGRPVIFANLRDGGLVLNEVYQIKRESVFSAGAGPELAGKPYVVVEYKAPNRYSWKNNHDIGDGRGNGGFGLLYAEPDNRWMIKSLKVFKDQPKMIVIYNKWSEKLLMDRVNKIEAEEKGASK